MASQTCWKAYAVVVGVMTASVALAADVVGNWRERTVKGVASSPWLEYYEWNAFYSPAGSSSSQTCRTGACRGTLTHDGRYIFLGVPNGPGTIYVDQPNFYAAPKVLPVNAQGSMTIDTHPNTDYHIAFGQNSGSWGANPWDFHGGTWRQTFVATGTGINRVSFKLAAEASTIQVSIHRAIAGPPSTWPQVGPTKQTFTNCSGCDLWVAWNYGEVPTTPGMTYAVAFRAVTGGIGFFVLREAISPGYPGGTAHKDDTPQTYDLYACIFSNNDGTILTYQMETSDIGPPTQWAGAWAQSFTARGIGLAAVGLFAQNPDAGWPADVLIHEVVPGGPQGPQIGPTKRLTHAGWYGPGTGFGGMSYNPGEISLTPGKQYLIVFSPYNINANGFNPLRRPGGDVYPFGTAYIGISGGWSERPYDLSMTILEYSEAVPTPVPTNTPTHSPVPTQTPTNTATPLVHRGVVEVR